MISLLPLDFRDLGELIPVLLKLNGGSALLEQTQQRPASAPPMIVMQAQVMFHSNKVPKQCPLCLNLELVGVA